MIFCNRFNCHNNDDGECASYENISLDENGTCQDFAPINLEDFIAGYEVNRIINEFKGEQHD